MSNKNHVFILSAFILSVMSLTADASGKTEEDTLPAGAGTGAGASAAANAGVSLEPLDAKSLTVGCGPDFMHDMKGAPAALHRSFIGQDIGIIKELSAEELPESMTPHDHPGKTIDLQGKSKRGKHVVGSILTHRPSTPYSTVYLEMLPPINWETNASRPMEMDFMPRVLEHIQQNVLQENGRLVMLLAMDVLKSPVGRVDGYPDSIEEGLKLNPFVGQVKDYSALGLRINTLLGSNTGQSLPRDEEMTDTEREALKLHRGIMNRRAKDLAQLVKKLIRENPAHNNNITIAYNTLCKNNLMLKGMYPLPVMLGQMIDPYYKIDGVKSLLVFLQQKEAMRTFLTEHGFENVAIEWKNEDEQPFGPQAGLFITATKSKVATD